MLNKLKPKSEFSRNVLTLMTGTTVAQAIPIAISPILTRLYTPEDFGVLALYMSIVSILGVIVTGQYELAIMLPKKENDALNIFYLSIIITSVISFLTLISVIYFNNEITLLLNNPQISKWLYLIPVSIFITGLFNSFNYWFNRNKDYKLLAKTKVTQSFINSGSNLSLGFLKLTNLGLILSSFLAQLIAVSLFIKTFQFKNIQLFHKKRILILAKKYKKFPKITMLHTLFNSFSNNIPVLLIIQYFSNKEAGFFLFTNRIIGMPLSIISGAISTVFFKEINDIKINQPKRLLTFYKSIIFKLLLLLIPLLTALFFILPLIIPIIFGEQWKDLAMYIQILLPMFLFRSIGSILSHIIVVFDRQFKGFILEILSFSIKGSSILIGGFYHDIYIGLVLFSILSSLLTLYRIIWYQNIIKEYINGL